MSPEGFRALEVSERPAASGLRERARDAVERLRTGVGKLAVIGVMASVSMGAFAGVESAEPSSASAATIAYENLGYPWANAPCEFGSAGGPSCANPNNRGDLYDWGEYGGGGFQAYRNGYEYRNCTDYVQWKESTIGVSVPGNWGNAAQWYDHASPGERAGGPQPGDVAVDPAGGFGHVAFVESVNNDGTITVSEYNYNGHGDGDVRTGSSAALGLSEFIDFGVHPGQGSGSPAESDDGVIASAAYPDGEQDVFWKGGDGNLWEAWYAGGRWNGPGYLGMGELGSAPTAAVDVRTGQKNVFWKGMDGNLWTAYYNQGGWHGPAYIGMGSLGSRPTATEWGNQIDVFWKGMDGNLWETVWNDNGPWVGPFDIGMGPLGSAPTAASHQDGEQDVFWRGMDGNLWEAWYAAGRWNGPVDLGMGPLGSAPTAAVQPATDEQDVFWKGADGNLWEAHYSGSWHGPDYIGKGSLGSAPSATAWGNEVDVFWRGLDSNLFETWGRPDQWNGPAALGMGPIPES